MAMICFVQSHLGKQFLLYVLELALISLVVGVRASLPDVIVYNKYPVYFKEQQGYHRDNSEFWVYGNDRPEAVNETNLERIPDTGLGYKMPNDTVARILEPQSSSNYRRIAYTLPVNTFSISGSYRINIPNQSSMQRSSTLTNQYSIFGRQQLSINMIKMPSKSSFQPDWLSKTVNLDEQVRIDLTPVDETFNPRKPVIWRRNGVIIEDWESSYLPIHSASPADAGVYEFYQDEADRSVGRIGLTRLIVRRCHQGYWGESCSFSCPLCYNGGVCDEMTGECICAPGFRGPNCENYCPATWFGQTCEARCIFQFSGEVSCSTMYMCLQDPFGCTCQGHQGLLCVDPCSTGSFGPDCSQKCHCFKGEPCDPDTGKCPSDMCAEGYAGSNCQQSSRPRVKYFYNVRTNPGASTKFICAIESPERVSPSSVTLRSPTGEVFLSSIEFSQGQGSGVIYPSNFKFELKVTTGGSYSCLLDKVEIGSTEIRYFDLPKLTDTPRVVQVDKTSVRLKWNKWKPFKDYGDAPLIGYMVYQTSLNSEVLIETLPGDAQFPEVFVSGLEPFTSYSFYVRLSRPGVKGVGEPSKLVNITTKCDLLRFAPSKLEVLSVSSSQVRIKWDRAPCNEDDIYVRSYSYHLALGASFFPNQLVEKNTEKCQDTTLSNQLRQVGVCASDTPVLTKGGLKAYTKYYFRVRSIMSGNEAAGPWSTVLPFQTSEAPPSYPRELGVVCSGDTIIKLSWQTPAEARGVLTHYEVRFIPEDSEDISGSQVRLLGSKEKVQLIIATMDTPKSKDVRIRTAALYEVEDKTGNTLDVSGLPRNKTFFFLVRAKNGAGWGNWSNLLKASSVIIPCPVMQKESANSQIYAPDAKVALISAVLVGVIITLTLIIVMIIALCTKKNNQNKRQQQAKYHQIQRPLTIDTNINSHAYTKVNKDATFNPNTSGSEKELNAHGTIRLCRHNNETDSLYNENDEHSPPGYSQNTQTLENNSSQYSRQSTLPQNNRQAYHSHHASDPSRSSTLNHRMSTFAIQNQTHSNYMQSPSLGLTLSRRNNGYGKQVSMDGAWVMPDGNIQLRTKSPNGADFSGSGPEDDHHTASQHDDSNTSSIQSEPIGAVNHVIQGPNHDSGAANKGSSHYHTYSSINPKNVGHPNQGTNSPSFYVSRLPPIIAYSAAAASRFDSLRFGGTGGGDLSPMNFAPQFSIHHHHNPHNPSHEHSLSVSDEASSNCSSTLTDQQQHNKSSPPLVAEHQPEASSASSNHSSANKNISSNSHNSSLSSPSQFRQPSLKSVLKNSTDPSKGARSSPCGTPSSAVQTNQEYPSRSQNNCSTISAHSQLASQTPKCSASSNTSASTYSPSYSHAPAAASVVTSSSASSSPSPHVHDSTACSCLQSPWHYRQDVNNQVVVRGGGMA